MGEQMTNDTILFVDIIAVYKVLSFTLFQLNSVSWLMVMFVSSSLFSIKAEKVMNPMFTLIFNELYVFINVN